MQYIGNWQFKVESLNGSTQHCGDDTIGAPRLKWLRSIDKLRADPPTGITKGSVKCPSMQTSIRFSDAG